MTRSVETVRDVADFELLARMRAPAVPLVAQNIKGRVVAAFLNRSQVSPIAEDSIAPLSAADVGELARRYTVLVECWK